MGIRSSQFSENFPGTSVHQTILTFGPIVLRANVTITRYSGSCVIDGRWQAWLDVPSESDLACATG